MIELSLPRSLRRVAAAACFFVAAFGAQMARAQIVEVGDGGPGPVKAEHLTAELTSLSGKVAAGGTVQLGLVLTIEEHWHVYWLNAGDSGEPPRVRWTLPKGVTVGPMQFPPPQRLPLGPLMDFGYEDQVAFPMEMKVSPTAKPGKVHLDAKVDWLVCSSQCLPGRAHLGIDLEVVKGAVAEAPLVGALGAAITRLPKALPETMSATAVGDGKAILVTLKTGGQEEDAEVYPFDADQIFYAADEQTETLPDGIKVLLQRANDAAHAGPELQTVARSTELPESLHLLIELSATEAYDVTVPVTKGTLPPMGATAKSKTSQATDVTAFGAIGLALLGGLLLNLMPCVFPVLFLKGLALVNSSGEERSRQRVHGLIYTLGILASFWAIVAVLLVVRAGGREIGWGFQLQSPGFVAVLASLVFFLGLSLAGQFELGLTLTSAGGELAQKQGFAGSFFTGVLATVVATPCMGPLMGAAVGFALAQPAWLTFTVFTALAIGLALPYLALSMQPQWTRLLPKPGAWMETLKQLSAVPLFATAIWLVWVYAQLLSGQDGIDRMAWLLSGFLVLAIAGWVLGRWPARLKGTIVAVLLIVVALALPLHTPAVETTTWKPYTEASFAAARESGKPVFLDFTAAWCLSCKVNEAAVLRSKDVEASLAKHEVVLLKADWTQYDPKITQMLASVGRSGVPTYVIYPPGKMSNADVLPELLTKDAVLKAIEKDAKAAGQN